ncbi:hypothetical protein [Arsenicitalea aurantiaca]|uniref:hypothetical protein n=1 Tax=Arsenicitalea aurantiaca TaxID=1783274 RepID=UPI0013156005|nr:hypothetical protein [Arsenicitalea aurantiaca]
MDTDLDRLRMIDLGKASALSRDAVEPLVQKGWVDAMADTYLITIPGRTVIERYTAARA